MRLASSVLLSTCNGSTLKSTWTLGVVLAGLLAVGLPSRAIHADTTLNSGTTTVSTGTNFGGDLYVATTGTATLEVIAGGYAANTTGYLGYEIGGDGTANVLLGGTWASSGELYVGYAGTGTLNVNGGSVTNSTGVVRTGTAMVSSGTWANSGGLYVGSYGTGTLNMTGGSITNTNGFLSYAGAGTANVLGGTWANSGELYIGWEGTGTLAVNGGSVTNTNGILSPLRGGVAAATVSSGTWANSGDLIVGGQGTGTLTVDGGSVTNTTGYLGYNASGVGTATVSSGTWANSGDLFVGYIGSGTLTMSGGLVTVGGTLSQGTYGMINLNAGGALQIGVGGTTGVLGVSTLTNNGTLIFNRSDDSTYSGIISGTGAVTKQGGGTLTLDGANSYSGLTTISGGVLAVSTVAALPGWDTAGRYTVAAGAGLAVGNAVPDGNVVIILNTNNFADGASFGFDTSDGDRTYAPAFTDTGSGSLGLVKLGPNTLMLTGANTYTGGSYLNGGVLSLENAGAVGSSGTISFGGGTLQYSASNTSDYSARILNSDSAIWIDTNGQNVTFATGLAASNTGGLTKSGLGTLTLSGSSAYTGATYVDGGSLFVNGRQGNTAVSVASGGLLGGSGTIDGMLTVLAGGTLSPGNSPGILHVGSLQLGGSSTTLMEITGTAAGLYDQIVATNNIAYGGLLQLTMSGSYANDTTFELFEFTSVSGSFSSLTMAGGSSPYAGLTFGAMGTGGYGADAWVSDWTTPSAPNGQRLVFYQNTGVLAVVPEPSTYAMALAGLACGGWQMWRRRRLQ